MRRNDMSDSKQILVMRHAKAGWGANDQRDFDRSLSPAGREEAPKVGRYLVGLDVVPEVFVSSPARRAGQTIRAVAEKVGFNSGNIRWDDDLYYGNTESYLRAVMQVPDEFRSILIVGHNPMVEQFYTLLTGRSFREPVAPGGIGCFECGIESWKSVQVGSCRLKWFVTPDDL